MATPALSRAQSSVPAAKDKGEVRLTLTGCVVAGERLGTFMITHMIVGGADAAKAPIGAVYFRLDTTKGLKQHVGHRVEIHGVADLADVDKGTVERVTDSSRRTTIAVNSERRTVRATIGESEWTPKRPVGTGGSVDTYKFKISSIEMLEGSCP